MSLQAPGQIFVNRPAWLKSSIPRSVAFDAHIHFICLMCHTALLSLIFIGFCVLHRIVSYDQSKRVKLARLAIDERFVGKPKFSFNRDRRSTPCFKKVRKLAYRSVNHSKSENYSGDFE
jgi:hypothetical protein